MNIDLGSPILDIAIGLSFVFLLLSLIASALNEGLAGVLNLRGKTLLEGIEGMVGDEETAQEVFEHPLVRTDGTKDTKTEFKEDNEYLSLWARFHKLERKPSYVSAANFAAALLDVAGKQKKAAADKGEEPPQNFLWKQLDALAVEVSPPGVAVGAAEIAKVEKWFDGSMERVSGWYKRRSQLFLVGFAIAVAIGLNANTLRIAERLEQEPSTRAAVVAAAEKSVEEGNAAKGTEAEEKEKEAAPAGEEKPEAVEEIRGAGEHFSEATQELAALKLPFLWGEDNSPSTMSPIDNALGWLLTVIAISLGAPFWFDTLGKLANLRSAGKKPAEATDPAGAK